MAELSVILQGLAAANGGVDGSTAVGIEGSTLKRFPVADPYTVGRLDLAAGSNTLSLAMCGDLILTSTSAGSTALLIPTFATLGFTRTVGSPRRELRFRVQRCGLGLLAVNGAVGVTINWNDLDPQYLGIGHPWVTLITRADNVWDAG